jgi:hypothetical protein
VTPEFLIWEPVGVGGLRIRGIFVFAEHKLLFMFEFLEGERTE